MELGVPSLFEEGRDGEESSKVHVLTVRDGSRRGLRQVASQRGLTKIRMESSDIGWIRWVKGREKGGRCSNALLLLLTSTGRAEGVDGWRQRSDTLLLWLAAILGRTWRRRTRNREMGSRVRTGY